MHTAWPLPAIVFQLSCSVYNTSILSGHSKTHSNLCGNHLGNVCSIHCQSLAIVFLVFLCLFVFFLLFCFGGVNIIYLFHFYFIYIIRVFKVSKQCLPENFSRKIFPEFFNVESSCLIAFIVEELLLNLKYVTHRFFPCAYFGIILPSCTGCVACCYGEV